MGASRLASPAKRQAATCNLEISKLPAALSKCISLRRGFKARKKITPQEAAKTIMKLREESPNEDSQKKQQLKTEVAELAKPPHKPNFKKEVGAKKNFRKEKLETLNRGRQGRGMPESRL